MNFSGRDVYFTSYKVQYQSFGASIPKKGDLPIGIEMICQISIPESVPNNISDNMSDV